MLVLGAILSCLLATGSTHISLTFPPARKYDLDFLGSANSKAPCGMPKGSIKTTLLAGKPFNITWHLAYPQKNGFRLQLLDKLERPVLDLTPVTSKSEYVTTDASSQHYTISIPSDYECEDCTIRLLKEAKEWSNNSLFWSCADVDIKTKKTYKEDCSGHGPYLLSKCRCNRLYYGPRCQYRDECVDNIDCGDMGRCVDLHTTSLPRKQCYCELGWFGPACKKRSPIRNSEMDFSNYLHRKLSPSFQLYWRILQEEQEIEIAMVANSTSYIGIGWRPSNATHICKQFPSLNSSEEQNITQMKSEPEVESESKIISPPEQNENASSNVSKVPDSQPESEPSSTISSTFLTGSRKPFRPLRTLSSRATKEQETPDAYNQPEVSSVTSVSYRVTSVQGSSRGKRENNAAKETLKDDKQQQVSRPDLDKESGTKTEPERSKLIPEPKSTLEKSSLKSTSEPKLNEELHSKPNSDLESEVKEKSKLMPKAETTSNINGQETSEEKDAMSYKVKEQSDFSPMDCTDMVIGMARGTSFRIWDYYTRDRSTPRLDTFYGGKNDLTAAMGFEKEGVTTIVFRKKLKAAEMTDHTIENALMHVVWAYGQDNSHTIESKSGLEQGDNSIKNFYKEDELKYHGHGDQRGVTTINFLEQAETPSLDNNETTTILSFCQGEWSHPKGCDLKKGECEYHASWHYIAKKGHIKFTISTKNTQLWTGIAFSHDHKMAQTDAIIGWVDKSGRPFMMDTWIVGHTAPLLDESQDIFNITGRTNDGITTLTFLRKRDTGDTKKDFAFSDDSCLYMMFPVKGGDYNPVNKKIRKHNVVPSFSSSKVCIKSCPEGDEPSTTPPPPHVNYNIEMKIINLGENYKAPRPNTDDFDILSNTIFSGLKNNIRKLSGFRNLQITEFRQEKDNIIAAMDLEVDQEQNERGRSLDESDSKIKQVVQSVVSSGKVGTLTLDPSYLLFQPVQTSWTVNNEETQKTTLLSITKLWVVIGCIIALLVVAVMQAGCTIYKTMHSTGSKHKDALTFNSAWKDYSTANTNYAFEPYEADEKQPHSLGQSNGSSRSTMPLHKPISAHPMVAYHANGSQYADTRSLQRPKGYQHPVERSTYSLPRTQPVPPQGYYTHRSARNNGDQLQPDFYFMPSQRKYSGMLQN